MTLVETSAVVAVLLEEPEGPSLLAQMNNAERPVMTVVGAVEAALSVGRAIKDHSLSRELVSDFLDKAGIEVVGIGGDLYDDVVRAYARYGKGTGHGAALNFGDCFSYAFARRAGTPLIYKGNDFAQTDIAAS